MPILPLAVLSAPVGLPEGRYASTLGARKMLRWVINRGWDTAPEEFGADRVRDSFVPDVIRRILPLGGTPAAVHAAEQERRLEDIRRLTGGPVPGAQLHVLAIGIADYGTQATRLKLDWADDDAADIALGDGESCCSRWKAFCGAT